MSYNPVTDFLATIRNGNGAASLAEVPGLDYVVAALARAGLIRLSVGQAAPLVNQTTTAWFKPALPSWTAEGVLYLWNPVAGAYAPATPVTWTAFLSGSGYSFQSVAANAGAINAGTSLLAIQRVAPISTALLLPNLIAQWTSGRKLQLVDFSTAVINHVVTLTTPDGSTIMQQNSWQLLSTADQLAGVTLQPSPDLNAWVIAP